MVQSPPVRRLGPGIQNVNFLFCLCEASQWIFWYRLYQRGSLSFFGKGTREIVHCGGAETCTLTEKHDAIAGITNACRVLQHGFEGRPKFAGRVRDDFQYLGGRRLLLARFFQVAPERADLLLEFGSR